MELNKNVAVTANNYGYTTIGLLNAPISVNNNIYIPFEEIFQLIGGTTSFNTETKVITANYNNKTYDFTKMKSYENIDESNQYFLYNNVAYVKILNLIGVCDYNISMENGTIQLYRYQPVNNFMHTYKIFGEMNITTKDEEIKKIFRSEAAYTVNPYVKYSYEMMLEDLEDLEKMYPDLISTQSLNKTYDGREIMGVTFGKGEKDIFICGSLHAREYISTTYIMYFIDRYAYNYEKNINLDGYDIRQILDTVTFHIMPMVNPDGVNIVQNGFGASLNQSNLVNMIKNDGAATYGSAAWKANSRGVDLNRNFSSGWYNKIVNEFKTTAPASSRFGGYSPESEIETQTMVAYLNTINPQAVLSFHTQGQIVYASTKGEAERKIARNISIESGFPVNTNNNPHGTFQDYIDEKYNVFYACIELCKYVGPYPYPNENFDKVWSPVRNACLITAKGVMEMGN